MGPGPLSPAAPLLGVTSGKGRLSLHDMDNVTEFSTESLALGRQGRAAVLGVLTASDILYRW